VLVHLFASIAIILVIVQRAQQELRPLAHLAIQPTIGNYYPIILADA